MRGEKAKIMVNLHQVPAYCPQEPAVSEEDSFRDLIQKVRAGNETAATELVRLYEPTIRLIASPPV